MEHQQRNWRKRAAIAVVSLVVLISVAAAAYFIRDLVSARPATEDSAHHEVLVFLSDGIGNMKIKFSLRLTGDQGPPEEVTNTIVTQHDDTTVTMRMKGDPIFSNTLEIRVDGTDSDQKAVIVFNKVVAGGAEFCTKRQNFLLSKEISPTKCLLTSGKYFRLEKCYENPNAATHNALTGDCDSLKIYPIDGSM